MHADPCPSVDTSPLDWLQSHLESGIRQGSLELPQLSPISSQALSMSADRHADAAMLSALIHRDQVLTGHMLRLANSEAFGGRSDIVSLRQAVAWLGMEVLAGLIVDLAVRDGHFNAPDFEQETERLWRHALTTGFCARAIARMRRRDGDTAFLCGLMRHIGRLVVLKAAAEARKDHRLKLKRADVLGLLDELGRQAGIHLAERWSLPAPVVASIRYDPGTDNGSGDLNGARIVYLGDRLAALHLGPAKPGAAEPWDPKLSQALELGKDAVKDLLGMGDTIREMVASISPDA